MTIILLNSYFDDQTLRAHFQQDLVTGTDTKALNRKEKQTIWRKKDDNCRHCHRHKTDPGKCLIQTKNCKNSDYWALYYHCFFLVRPLILDIPYLKRPKTVYLDCLEFEIERGTMDTTSDYYYLHGVDMNGEKRSFKISEKQFREGRRLIFEEQISTIC